MISRFFFVRKGRVYNENVGDNIDIEHIDDNCDNNKATAVHYETINDNSINFNYTNNNNDNESIDNDIDNYDSTNNHDFCCANNVNFNVVNINYNDGESISLTLENTLNKTESLSTTLLRQTISHHQQTSTSKTTNHSLFSKKLSI